MSLHPQIIERAGKKEYVILPYEEFLTIQESLEDYADLKKLREAKSAEASAPTVPLQDVMDDLLNQ